MNEAIQQAPLGDLIELRNEKVFANKDANLPYIGLEQIAQGQPRLLGYLPGDQSISANNIFQKDDILFGKLRPNLRKSVRVSMTGYCSTDILVLRALQGVSPSFAGHILQFESVFNAAAASAEGTKMPRTSWAELKHFRVFKPATECEQARIARILDAADALIAKSEAVIGKLRQVRAGLLHDLLTRGLDADSRLRDPATHPEQFKDSPLGRIPREWEVESVGSLFEMQLGKMLSPAAKGGNNSKPYVGNRHVLWERVDTTNLEYMDFTEVEMTKYALQTGDLLICEGGEVGRTALWRGELSECYFQKAIHRLRPKDYRMIPEFMLAFMIQASLRNAFENLTSQTSIAHLTQEKLAILLVVCPPRAEQEAISALLATHDRMIAAEQTELAKLRQLKSGLMTDLLEGRVRVPAS